MTKDEMESILGRIHGRRNWRIFSDRDLVIEAVIENMGHERKVIRRPR